MSKGDTEVEAKFYLRNLAALEQRLQGLGAELTQPQVHETNLRFDLPDRSLSRQYQALRLRQDTEARLTYKGPSSLNAGARSRTELEFSVSDFDAARAFLEALGYQIYLKYEKRRTTYQLAGVIITLDVMPYGDFVEIEGPDGGAIRQMAERLGLDWDARINESYTSLFETLRRNLDLPFQHLSFEYFDGLTVTSDDLDVDPGDE